MEVFGQENKRFDRKQADQQAVSRQREPAELLFRQLSVCRLSFHRRIIPDRGQSEQGILGGCYQLARMPE
jgi:hypothetical protein